jgi:hypothetical protein
MRTSVFIDGVSLASDETAREVSERRYYWAVPVRKIRSSFQ